MGRLRRTGGEAVQAGTYWNFETGKKVKLERFGLLPGTPSQSYYKAPPMLILAFAAAAAHLFIYVLPKYLTQLYAAYAENLVTTYVIADFLFLFAALAGLCTAAAGDILKGRRRVPAVASGQLATVEVKSDEIERNG